MPYNELHLHAGTDDERAEEKGERGGENKFRNGKKAGEMDSSESEKSAAMFTHPKTSGERINGAKLEIARGEFRLMPPRIG